MTKTAKSSETSKIAFVSDAVYPYNKGGKEKRLFEVSTRLAKEGFAVTIYCMKWWKGGEQERFENGVRLKAISPHYPLYVGSKRSIKQALFFMLHCFKLLREDFDVLDVDHMPHLVLFSTKLVCVLKRKKLIGSWNEVWGKEYWNSYLGGLKGKLAYLVETISVRLPDVIISISLHTTQKLRKDLKVRTPIYTIPLGVDQTIINAVVPAKERCDVLYAGRLLSHKNVDTLLRSIALLKKKNPQILCRIIGEGPERKNLEKLASTFAIEKNVAFLDFIPGDDALYAQMKASRVFVLPSLREGFGLVVIEANACNVPVIVVDHPDNAAKDLIKNGQNGYVVENTPKDMAEKIEKLLAGKKRNYKQYGEAYNWDTLIQKLIPIYSL